MMMNKKKFTNVVVVVVVGGGDCLVGVGGGVMWVPEEIEREREREKSTLNTVNSLSHT